MPPSLLPEASCPGILRQGDQIREPATPTRDAYLSLGAQQYVIPKRRHGQVTKVLDQATLIITEWSTDSRNRTPRARVSHHIQKPKRQASIKNKINFINYSMFTLQYTKDDGGRTIAMAMLPLPPTKPITLPGQCGFSGGGKKRVC